MPGRDADAQVGHESSAGYTTGREGKMLTNLRLHFQANGGGGFLPLNIFMISIMCSLVFGGTSAAATCGRISPADYFWRKERPGVMQRTAPRDPGATYGTDWLRSLSLYKTKDKYSSQNLRCWIRSGDPLASYILAIQSVNIHTIYDYSIIDIPRVDRLRVELLTYASSPHSCDQIEDKKEAKYYGCGEGLPESAYALLALNERDLLPRKLEAGDLQRLCRVAAGLIYSDRLCHAYRSTEN